MPAKQPRMLPLLTASQLPWRPPVREINPFGGLGVEPTRLFPIIVLSSLVTVEYGGWALLAGVLAQSGGFFVHLGLGQQGRISPGTVLTRAGAPLIAAALIILAIGLITHG